MISHQAFGNCSFCYPNLERPILISLLKCVLFYLFVSTQLYFIRFSMNAFSLRGLPPWKLVGSSGLEPPTSRLSGARSNHLSYEPIKLFRCISSLSPFRLFALSSPSGVELTVFVSAMRHWLPTLLAGGDDGIRTHDPLLAGQVLSQLSYTPISWGFLPVTENWTT